MIASELAALFVCRSSPYRGLGLDCYDRERDALTYKGAGRVIAHPPCRGWGRLRHLAKPRLGELELAIWAMELVRRNGGILEHPVSSGLWKLLEPGDTTLLIRQCDFGHRAEKRTRLFYARMPPPPPLPSAYVGPLVLVKHMGRQERERTPLPLAQWLVSWCRS